ncbi:MAG: RND family transporter [Deltaproteobacteria bacterium]|nr:RND family transporter [Deltaproteobacteria bacterium]MBT4263219.1 RND family transporter [Deltaproteobacteria bacterium]MBT4642340.1 RND family transporter [Deltaproteobacteria bacterium]MBT6500535.1 RND family transporter [Deltaproteobacteria bacterium]MBT6614006.1 RND family transporter [Deltaproteobacteria bacterium]
MLKRFYNRVILEHPLLVLMAIIIAIALLGYQARKLEIDASAETLTLEDDKDLKLSRLFWARFKSQDFLVITFTPKGDLLGDESLDIIRRLKADLLKLEMVESVTSILDVPLMESPPLPVKEMVKNVPTLESPGIDKNLARKEFLNSSIYQNNLVSPDFKNTAILANLHDDPKWQGFLKKRDALRQKEKKGTITIAEQQELEKVLLDFKAHRDMMRDKVHDNIVQVRALMEKYKSDADLFLGGVSMIADDLVTFIKGDLSTFGLGVLFFLVITLWIIFRQLRWILLPILCCSFSVIATCGLLGLFGWEVSVISSNFISIQLIITMAMTIHLIVRYRELAEELPDADQRELVLESTLSMAKPCLFAILTTMAGFSSLVFSGIRPIISFGWMMTAGIGVSLILTFLLFPTVLMLMEKSMPNRSFESYFAATKKMADFTEHRGRAIIIVSALILIWSIVGSSKLMVENSFIDYFKESTEIYQGMKMIDQQLGGTTPLDVIVDLGVDEEEQAPASTAAEEEDEDEDDLDEFEEEFKEEENKAQYWFTSDKMDRVEKIHDYLETVPELGKVMSLGTMLKVGKTLNDGEPLDNFLLALIYNELPEKFRKIVLSPFVSVEHNQARFSVRIRDSEPTLRRDALLKRIRRELTEKVGLKAEDFQLSGMMVLYNNMLQSLFDSQIMTLGTVLLVLMVMFWILFRSLRIALIAIFPNLLSVGVILGFMGWVGIPLDLMTITIAAISVGIAVDDTIHYIHRFKKEFAIVGNYLAAMHRSHESIGYAMYYTSITIVIGFSILILSNFIPGIYFGLLTGLAMVIALVAALTLLPQLMVFIKPLGPEKG